MIIHQPEIFEDDGDTILWSRIEFERPRDDFPQFLWYMVPTEHARHLSLHSDAFLLPGLLAGMHFGEEIEVRGAVSPLLAYQLDEYQYLLNFRMPKAVRPVRIKYSHLEPLSAHPKAVGTAFSGGVDSIFALWRHTPGNQPIPGYRITHALFIMGFDIVRKKEAKYRHLLYEYTNILKEIDIELIPIETNIVRAIIPRMTLNQFYGPILAGCAHLFAVLFKRFYISSSRDYFNFRIRMSSSDPLADSLLSSDTLDLLHHGATHPRVEKIKEISDWQFAHKNLRVCTTSNLEGNCSRCEKCVRTMIPLFALDKMTQFSTFKKPIKSNRDILLWARKFDPSNNYFPEMIPFIKQHKKELLPWLRLCYLLGTIRYQGIRLIPGVFKRFLSRFGYFIDSKLEQDAYENQEVIKLLRRRIEK